jgi:DNA-binding helix-hairpin-helix protein with protein kinase domain
MTWDPTNTRRRNLAHRQAADRVARANAQVEATRHLSSLDSVERREALAEQRRALDEQRRVHRIPVDQLPGGAEQRAREVEDGG